MDAAGRSATPADILVQDGAIAQIGDPGLAAPEGVAVFDASDRLLMPGMINAHAHSGGNLARSIHDKWTLELLLNGTVANVGGQTLEEKYISTLLGALEMLSKGCTGCYDLFYEFPLPSEDGIKAAAQAYADAGMRAVIAPMLADRSFYRAIPGLLEALPDPYREQFATAQALPWQAQLDIIAQVMRGWAFDRDRITLAIAPSIPMHCTDEFLAGAAAFTRDHGIGFHTHLAESRVQAVYGRQRYGRSPTAQLRCLGVLGPNFTAAHAVWVDDDDIAMLADAGASVAHNPGSNMRLGSGMAATRRMLDRGLNVGLGTDSRVCSDNLNMFEAMRFASYASRVQGPDHERWLSTPEVFAMATEGSAKALGFGDRLGRLAPGYRADIVFLDLGNLNWVPLNDTTNQLVFAEDGTAVDSVMVDGRLVYHQRRFPGIDMASLRRKAQSAADRLRGANAEMRAVAAALEPVVACFCGALAREPHHIHRFTGGEIA
nr:amidohydrolase family protein [Neoroseomonas terrae]